MARNPQIRFRFRRPGGFGSIKPSTAMQTALRHLCEAQEMRPLLNKALNTGREVVIDVFHSSSGEPLLFHPTLIKKGAVQ